MTEWVDSLEIGMIICLLFLMPYSLLSETAHEWIARLAAVITAGYGIYAFFDYQEGVFPFLVDYLAIMIFIACIGYYGGKVIRNIFV